MNQNPKQEVASTSDFLEEVVEEADFDEATGEPEVDKLADSQQSKLEEKEQPKKAKRPRKTIEQELAELDARRQRLMEKKRSQEAHKKIVFGAVAMKVFKIYSHIEKNKNGWKSWKNQLRKEVSIKDKDVLKEIINEIEV